MNDDSFTEFIKKSSLLKLLVIIGTLLGSSCGAGYFGIKYASPTDVIERIIVLEERHKRTAADISEIKHDLKILLRRP